MGRGPMRFHGGDREAKIDFSININPLGPPQRVYEILEKCIRRRVIERYPDYAYRDLRRSLADFYGASMEQILPTNGAAEAINLTILSLRPSRIYVIEPSYGEYEDLAKALNAEYRGIPMKIRGNIFHIDYEDVEMICDEETSLLVVTNPNNPTGIYENRETILSMADRCSFSILLDEAYIELCDRCPIEVSNIPENVVIVRTLTKWLALPGLRIGFLYTSNRGLYEKLDTMRQPWNVNALAECLLVKLFKEKDFLMEFINGSRSFIREERSRVTRLLRDANLDVFESDTNILLFRIKQGGFVIRKLSEKGIAVRSCTNFKGLGSDFIRIGIRSRAENNLLVELLREVVNVVDQESG